MGGVGIGSGWGVAFVTGFLTVPLGIMVALKVAPVKSAPVVPVNLALNKLVSVRLA